MARVDQMIESKYLKQADIPGEMVVTIQKVGKANVAREGDEPEYKWLVRFDELPKPMVLNSTNIKRLARACQSQESDDWVGKKVLLYVDPDVEFAGNVVGGLRIKAIQGQPPKKGTALQDLESDVPF